MAGSNQSNQQSSTNSGNPLHSQTQPQNSMHQTGCGVGLSNSGGSNMLSSPGLIGNVNLGVGSPVNHQQNPLLQQQMMSNSVDYNFSQTQTINFTQQSLKQRNQQGSSEYSHFLLEFNIYYCHL